MGPCIPTPDAAERKPYTFRYSILPHENDWREDDIYKHGMEINMPLIPVQIKRSNNNVNGHSNGDKNLQSGTLANRDSFLKIDKENVILSTIKLSNDRKTIILRIYETEGKKTSVKIKLALNVKAAEIVDLMGNKIQEIKNIENNEMNIEIDAFKILTFKIFS
jgi:alpha-mannosidase